MTLLPTKGDAKKLGSLLRSEIPIPTTVWDVNVPRFLEGDTVTYCVWAPASTVCMDSYCHRYLHGMDWN